MDPDIGTEGRSSRPVRARDVAERAGVSIATVSKAISGKGSLRPETRRRVLDAAEALGFHRNLLAESLLSGRTNTIGVITSDHFGRFTSPVLLGALDAMAGEGYALVLGDGKGDAIRERHFVESMLSRRVDGILVTGAGVYGRPPLAFDSIPVPVVYALGWVEAAAGVSIVPDQVEGGRLAIRHLLATGRTRIGYLGGISPAGNPSVRDDAAEVRLRGVREALRDADLELIADPYIGEWSERSGREGVARLLRSGVSFDGLVCGSDQVARGVVDGLRDARIDVPGSVAVIGFDNWDLMVEASRPPLSSIDLGLESVGRTAVRRLTDAIATGQWRNGIDHVPVRLVQRESTSAEWRGGPEKDRIDAERDVLPGDGSGSPTALAP